MRRFIPVFILCALVAGCVEDFESEYATIKEVEEAGSDARSWLPRWLPKSATNIRERHNIDSNATLVAFDAPSFSPSMLDGCRPGRSAAPRGDASWWPTDEQFERLKHFACEEKTVFGGEHVEVWQAGVAWNREAGRVYFWRNGG